MKCLFRDTERTFRDLERTFRDLEHTFRDLEQNLSGVARTFRTLLIQFFQQYLYQSGNTVLIYIAFFYPNVIVG